MKATIKCAYIDLFKSTGNRDPMLWQNKVSWIETTILAAMWETNRKEGDHFTDFLVWVGAGAKIALIIDPTLAAKAAGWAAPYVVPAAAAVAVPVATGGVIAAAIGGKQGIKDYADFIIDKPLGPGQRKKFVEVVIPAIESEIIEPVATYIDDTVVKPIEKKLSWGNQNIVQPVLRFGNWYAGRYGRLGIL